GGGGEGERAAGEAALEKGPAGQGGHGGLLKSTMSETVYLRSGWSAQVCCAGGETPEDLYLFR
ncbi:MAG: hypothetical protein M0Z84_15995, partial [Gammaproteobacteria bacterium]|nr:hypothetical protein [Gammaproteobacteria bacterium]